MYDILTDPRSLLETEEDSQVIVGAVFIRFSQILGISCTPRGYQDLSLGFCQFIHANIKIWLDETLNKCYITLCFISYKTGFNNSGITLQLRVLVGTGRSGRLEEEVCPNSTS